MQSVKLINDEWVYDCKTIGRYLRLVEAHICCVLLPPDGVECCHCDLVWVEVSSGFKYQWTSRKIGKQPSQTGRVISAFLIFVIVAQPSLINEPRTPYKSRIASRPSLTKENNCDLQRLFSWSILLYAAVLALSVFFFKLHSFINCFQL
jgi:hypothetical protein